jgi:hypothetical protein
MNIEELKEVQLRVLAQMQYSRLEWENALSNYKDSLARPKVGQEVKVYPPHVNTGKIVIFEKVVVVFELNQNEPVVMYQCKNQELNQSEYYEIGNIFWENSKQ